jgi:hypothetical protein
MDGSIHVEMNCPPREGLHADEIATLQLLKKRFENLKL